MRIAGLLVALLTIVVGIGGIVSPDAAMTLRRSYYTPVGIYAAGAVRLAMGLVLLLAASGTRWPRTLRLMGVVMCLQGLTASLLGLEHARAVLEWEGSRTGLLRAGAVMALVSGGFMAFALVMPQTSWHCPHHRPGKTL